MIRDEDRNLKNTSISSTETMISKQSGDVKATATDKEAKLVDRYGFYVSDDFHTSLLVSEEEIVQRREKEAERTTKWIKMIKNWDNVVITRKEKLKRRVRKGIPDHVRGFVWTKLSNASIYRTKYPKLGAIDVTALDELTIDEVNIRIMYCISLLSTDANSQQMFHLGCRNRSFFQLHNKLRSGIEENNSYSAFPFYSTFSSALVFFSTSMGRLIPLLNNLKLSTSSDRERHRQNISKTSPF
jgi:hypothetical protein